MLKKYVIFFLIFFFTLNLYAVKTNKKPLIAAKKNKVNDEVKKAYMDLLRKSQDYLKDNPSDFTAAFNVGYANYKMRKYQEGLKYFLRALTFAGKNKTKAAAQYNIGNSYFMLKKLKQALLRYKKGLIYNPHDEDIRYNYTVTKMILDNSKNQKKKNKKQNDKNKKNKQKNKQKNDKQKKKNKKKTGKMNKEDAMRILNALKNREKKSLPKKVYRIRGPKKDKDW